VTCNLKVHKARLLNGDEGLAQGEWRSIISLIILTRVMGHIHVPPFFGRFYRVHGWQHAIYIYIHIYLFLDIMTLYMWFLYVGLINLSDFRVLQNHLSLITVDIEEEAFLWVLLDVGGFFKTVFNSQGGSLISFE